VHLLLKVDTLSKTSTSSLFTKINNYQTKHKLLPSNSTVIVGLSGGPDSIFLLYFLLFLKKQLNLTIIAAHLDHEWRTESYQDVTYCKQVTNNLDIEFVSEKSSNITLTKKTKGSIEEQGRLLRRTFFENILYQNKGDLIALAHHNDDQQETFFIRLFRGAGVTGLAGIKPKNGPYIHPLLCIKKQNIINWLDKNNITYLIDPTNQNDQFLRNKIRNHILPELNQCDSRFNSSLNRTMERLHEADEFISMYTKKQYKTILLFHNNKIWININKLLTHSVYIKRQLLIHWFIQSKVPFTPSTQLFNEVLRFIKNSKNIEHTLYPSWKLTKKTIESKQYVTITFCL